MFNHRKAVAAINISCRWLLASYRFNAWNGGLLLGTLCYADKDSATHVLAYGDSGIWQTTSAASSFADFNVGHSGVDYRNIRGMVRTCDGSLLAAG